jgi:hypothetical protein
VDILNAHINDSVKADLDKLTEKEEADIARTLAVYKST